MDIGYSTEGDLKLVRCKIEFNRLKNRVKLEI